MAGGRNHTGGKPETDSDAVALALEMHAGGDPYTESTFAVHLGNWATVAHPEVTMRVNWRGRGGPGRLVLTSKGW